jgi:tetratricopeptide (TPR) repeat protein
MWDKPQLGYETDLNYMIGYKTSLTKFSFIPERDFTYSMYLRELEPTKLFNDGVRANEKGEHERAIKLYKEALRITKEDIYYNEEIYSNLYRSLMILGEFEQAFDICTTMGWSGQIARKNVKEREERMKSMNFPLSENTEKKLLEANEEIIMNHLAIKAWYERGKALLAFSKWELAIHTFDKILQLDKNSYMAWYLKDYAYVKYKETKNNFQESCVSYAN